MSIGNVVAIQAALSNQTSPNSIFGQYPDEQRAQTSWKRSSFRGGEQFLRWALKNNRHCCVREGAQKEKPTKLAVEFN